MSIQFIDRRDTGSQKWDLHRGKDIIPLWVADTDAKVAPAIIDALSQSAAHGVFGYSSMPSDDFIDCIIAYFKRRWDWAIEREWLVFSPGLGAAIHNITRMACDDGGRAGIVTPSPIYHVFRTTTDIYGQNRQDAPMHLDDGGVWRLPLSALEAACDDSSRVLHLCNPHNPNGKVFSRAELEQIAEFCLRRDLIISADEVHADIILDEDKTHIPIASLSPEIALRTITFQSPSKAYNIAGLNFAVVVIPDSGLRKRYLAAAAGRVGAHLNIFGMRAAQAAYSGDADSWLQQMNAQLRQNRDRLREAVGQMDGISMSHLEATYLAWLNVEALALADAPAHFTAGGLALSPGAIFGDARYMRLNFGCSPELLSEVIHRLRAACARAAEKI